MWGLSLRDSWVPPTPQKSQKARAGKHRVLRPRRGRQEAMARKQFGNRAGQAASPSVRTGMGGAGTSSCLNPAPRPSRYKTTCPRPEESWKKKRRATMSPRSREQQQRPGGRKPCLSRSLFLLVLTMASAQADFPGPRECVTYQSDSHSSVSCYSPSTFPGPLPRDTVRLAVEFSSLTRLPADALRGTPGLRELHLSSNRLEELPAELLLPVPGLKVLDLTRNALTQLPPSLFRASAALHTLVLKENRLRAMQASWLHGLKALAFLDLSGNHLRVLPPGLLANLPVLRTLDLGDNQLEVLPPALLRGPLDLERLDLQGNRLRALGEDLLAPQPGLRYLFLNDNRLAVVAAGAFRGLRQLDMLDLSNNLLTTVPRGLWVSLGKPTRDMRDGFDLSGNPWVCDQNLDDLYRWLLANRHRMFSWNGTCCAGPEALKGQVLLTVAGSP
ncbi:leucine-rich alpha-2-glycoprotein [Fukomys damarensis]|uniref:leucine-rich alpha-2-glycoprotein n=1 Tax=Fukomys damarensis TaxID=885580 RepID=UPI00053FB07B|nr:leucine-rich alpha-2-glycoprotein [Fukomys damarensis]